jgi:hypothetical protein
MQSYAELCRAEQCCTKLCSVVLSCRLCITIQNCAEPCMRCRPVQSQCSAMRKLCKASAELLSVAELSEVLESCAEVSATVPAELSSVVLSYADPIQSCANLCPR